MIKDKQRTAVVAAKCDISRFALKKQLEELGFDVISEVQSESELSNVIGHAQPDLVVTDQVYKLFDKIEALQHLKLRSPTTRYLFFIDKKQLLSLFEILSLDYIGVVTKKNFCKVTEAIEKIFNEEIYLDDVSLKLLMKYNQVLSRLSPNEKIIIQLFMQNKKVDEMIEITNYSDRTIKRKKADIISKIGRKNFNEICHF